MVLAALVLHVAVFSIPHEPRLAHLLGPDFARVSECVLATAAKTQCEYEDMNLLPLVRWAAGEGSRPGTFVELGANDGFTGSITWLLEKCFGWNGY